MVAIDQLQLHFSALLIDARKKNNAVAFALVPDNPVAPKQILSTPRHQPSFRIARTRSSMGRISDRISPKPTKKLPRRSRSAPSCSTGEPTEQLKASRWTSETTPCGCESSIRARNTPPTSSASNCSSRRTSQSPPRIPRRSRDEEGEGDMLPIIAEVVSSLPPQLPRRKAGEAVEEWKNRPPQIPCRLPDSAAQLECF